MDEISVREFRETDYELFVNWGRAHGWEPLPISLLPSGKVVLVNDNPICMGFKYITNSMMSWIEWVMSDPTSDKEIRSLCLDKLIESLIEDREPGEVFMTCIESSHKGLEKRYKQFGFKVTDQEMQVMIKAGK